MDRQHFKILLYEEYFAGVKFCKSSFARSTKENGGEVLHLLQWIFLQKLKYQ